MSRIAWLRVVLVVGALAGLTLSPSLWLSSRDFPLSPAGGLLPGLPSPLDGVALGALVLALVLAAVPKTARPASIVAVALAALLVAQDQMRLQPWMYQYVLMLGLLALVGTRPLRFGLDEAGGRAALRLVMVCTYLWSGLHKVNLEFVEVGFPWLVQPFVGEEPGGLVAGSAWAVPWVEAAIGVGLALPPWRRTAVVAGCGMHAFILAAIGPFGHDWNPVVWPWNVVMPVLLVLLFWNERGTFGDAILVRRPAIAALVVLVGLLPATNALGFWDGYTSFALYSYSGSSAFFIVDERQLDQLPEHIEGVVHEEGTGRARVLADAWSFAAVGVPVYPARRVYRQLHEALCVAAPDDVEPPLLVVHTRERLSGRRQFAFYRCGEEAPFDVRDG